MQNVFLILLDEYTDWEGAFLSIALNGGVMPGREVKYETHTVAPTLAEVRSIGGFRTLPDYSFTNMPSEYAALVLIGGYGWSSPEAAAVAPLVQKALNEGRIVGAICNGASFLAAHGFLNAVRHTGNGLAQLKQWGGGNYTNEAGYVEEKAVRDGGIVTANGLGHLEFTRELLLQLRADEPEIINGWYDFFTKGLIQ